MRHAQRQKPIRLAGHDYLSLIGVTGKGSKLEEIQSAAEGVMGGGRTLKPVPVDRACTANKGSRAGTDKLADAIGHAV